MLKTLKLSASLGGLVTASVAATAFALPQFNSTESYLFKNLNTNNWSQYFTSSQAAQDYLEGVVENGLLNEVEGGKRTVSSYLVNATMEGLDANFLFFEDKEETFSGQSDNTLDDYNAIKNEFINLLTENFVNQLVTMESNVYIPLEDYVSGGATTSTGGTHALAEYFRGAGDIAYDTLDSAFISLLDQTGIAFEYNSVNYNTIAEVVLAWMTDNGFEGTTAYKTVTNHIRWEAEADYTDSNGVDHGFIESSTSITDSDAFKTAAQTAFYNRMAGFENALVTEHAYTTAEWEATTDYTSSRDAWINSNDINVEPLINDVMLKNTMGEAWGYAITSGSKAGTIDGPGDDFFPVRTTTSSKAYYYYQSTPNIEAHADLPELDNALSNDKDIMYYSFMAFLGPNFSEEGTNAENYMKSLIGNYCSSTGVSQRNTDEWKSWTAYAEFMGFDNVVIPVEDRNNATPNTINKWWEFDCEGLYAEGNYGTGHVNVARFFNDTFSHYFDYELEQDNQWTSVYNQFFIDWYSSTANQPLLRDKPTQFTFNSNIMNGDLTGLTMIEALLDGNKIPATEADYKATAADYQRDFLDWETSQDIILYWNNAEYRGQSESAATALVNAAISARIEAEWINIAYTQITNVDYDIDDAHLAVIRAIDPTIVATDYYSIEQARTAVRSSIESNGADNIWSEIGLVKFIDDSYYNFDTTVDYNSIGEALLDVSWNTSSSYMTSAIGQTGTYSTMKEYHLDTVMKLLNFNGTTTDIMFDMSINELANRLINGYDLSHLDSSLSRIAMNITDYDLDDVYETTEYVTYKFSLEIDEKNENETYWVESEEFILNSEEHLPSLIAAKEELINYWKDKLLEENK